MGRELCGFFGWQKMRGEVYGSINGDSFGMDRLRMQYPILPKEMLSTLRSVHDRNLDTGVPKIYGIQLQNIVVARLLRGRK